MTCLSITGKVVVILILVVDVLFSYLTFKRYVIDDDWELLPDLGRPLMNQIFIGTHIILGILLSLQGPLQFLLKPPAHKITGVMYIAECSLSALCGLIFIAINSYQKGIFYGTVGGLGMTAAFSIFGILFYISANLTALYAYHGNKKLHKEWALRTYVLGISSFTYRVLYFVAFAFGYSIRRSHVYEDFSRPLDQIFNWMFFVPGLIIVECIIRFFKPFSGVLETEVDIFRRVLYQNDETEKTLPLLPSDTRG